MPIGWMGRYFFFFFYGWRIDKGCWVLCRSLFFKYDCYQPRVRFSEPRLSIFFSCLSNGELIFFPTPTRLLKRLVFRRTFSWDAFENCELVFLVLIRAYCFMVSQVSFNKILLVFFVKSAKLQSVNDWFIWFINGNPLSISVSINWMIEIFYDSDVNKIFYLIQ